MPADDALTAAWGTINDLGFAHYFIAPTLARGSELGLDGFRFYFLGRGGVLGDVEAPVVASAFGYFNPSLVETMWDSARAVVAPRDAARAYLECGADLARSTFGDVEGLSALCAAGEEVVSNADRAGLALFAGMAAEPLPDDEPARAYQLVNVLRELRGSLHLLAVVATGLPPRMAHLMRRPEMDQAFGWTDPPEVDDAHRALQADADALTDRLCSKVYGVLDDAGVAALASGVEGMRVALAG